MQQTQGVNSTDQREKMDTFSYVKINKSRPSIESVNKLERQTTERGALVAHQSRQSVQGWVRCRQSC